MQKTIKLIKSTDFRKNMSASMEELNKTSEAICILSPYGHGVLITKAQYDKMIDSINELENKQ